MAMLPEDDGKRYVILYGGLTETDTVIEVTTTATSSTTITMMIIIISNAPNPVYKA